MALELHIPSRQKCIAFFFLKDRMEERSPWRMLGCLAVFGNGRTHTGEVTGSGGSRLANYFLRAISTAVLHAMPFPRTRDLPLCSALQP
ncbi:hypothetical protein AOXY_G10075 [Acipenser oxyrinchus oxyrinchus]|uniref:Uncharacterized protein n=1 Tax=Acipenser oxyrinchus oxyrinchus TaxID=40147 RepID=A0AAD8DHL2_ACIOX|nr:hypothetical protein AOXY_G10075 [Acipenser oxyrinchus oxyrinchus]